MSHTYAYSIHDKDGVTLGDRLESGAGKVVVEKHYHRKAHSDGEGLGTPMVQQAPRRSWPPSAGERWIRARPKTTIA